MSSGEPPGGGPLICDAGQRRELAMGKARVEPRRGRPQPRPVERRKSDRAPVVVRVDYTTVDSFFSEFSANINEGGLFIETEAPHAPGTHVALQFHLPQSDEPVKVSGRVAWSSRERGKEPLGMGIEFENLDQVARERINQLVRKLRIGGG